jgi:hypothetical protein
MKGECSLRCGKCSKLQHEITMSQFFAGAMEYIINEVLAV